VRCCQLDGGRPRIGRNCGGDENESGVNDACDEFAVPVASAWGLVVMPLLTLTGGTMLLRGRCHQAA